LQAGQKRVVVDSKIREHLTGDQQSKKQKNTNEADYGLPRASLTGFHTVLPIFDLEPLDLQIGVLTENQLILAEPSILRLLGYKQHSTFTGNASIPVIKSVDGGVVLVM
jgi:hypothetical protein